MSPPPSSSSRRPLTLLGIIVVAVIAIALHGVENTSSLNLIFPVVLDAIQWLFGSSHKDESIFEYADDGLPLCNKCHCTPTWDQDPSEFKCPSSEQQPPPPWQYPKTTIDILNSQDAMNPYMLECDPYYNTSCDTIPSLEQEIWNKHDNAVCGLIFEKPHERDVKSWRQHGGPCPLNNYTMQTFESAEYANKQNAVITHDGPCGACSTTRDLATYMSHPDMVHAGRKCTNRILILGHDWGGVSCYQALGFTKACAEIWARNSYHTATVCRSTCVRHLFSPPNLPEPHCKLNDCLHCDEVKSGPNFQRFAGRTRRNSGLRTPILRQCKGLANIEHQACPVDIVIGK